MSRPASPQPTSSADVVEMAALPSSSPRRSSLQLDSRSSSAEISHEAGEEEQKALLPYPAILQRRALAQELYHTLRECTTAFEQLPRSDAGANVGDGTAEAGGAATAECRRIDDCRRALSELCRPPSDRPGAWTVAHAQKAKSYGCGRLATCVGCSNTCGIGGGISRRRRPRRQRSSRLVVGRVFRTHAQPVDLHGCIYDLDENHRPSARRDRRAASQGRLDLLPTACATRRPPSLLP